MNFLAKLATEAKAAGLEFLLIGGNAVIAYGSKRTTEDVDLLISEEQLGSWREFVTRFGYTAFVDYPSFVQFTPPRGLMRLDLMLVSASTWAKMYAAREQRPLGDATFDVPAGVHIIALKLHALRQNPSRSTDWDDIEHLIDVCNIDVQGSEFRAIVSRYGSPSAYARILQRNPPA